MLRFNLMALLVGNQKFRKQCVQDCFNFKISTKRYLSIGLKNYFSISPIVLCTTVRPKVFLIAKNVFLNFKF